MQILSVCSSSSLQVSHHHIIGIESEPNIHPLALHLSWLNMSSDFASGWGPLHCWADYKKTEHHSLEFANLCCFVAQNCLRTLFKNHVICLRMKPVKTKGPSLHVGTFEKGEVEWKKVLVCELSLTECLRVILVLLRVMVIAQECVKRRALILTVFLQVSHSRSSGVE